MIVDPKSDQRNAMDRNEAFGTQYDNERMQKQETGHSDFRKNQRDKKIVVIILTVIAVLLLISALL